MIDVNIKVDLMMIKPWNISAYFAEASYSEARATVESTDELSCYIKVTEMLPRNL